MPSRTAEAAWEGGLKSGKGTMMFGGGAFNGAYSYTSRFEEAPGTNPEELIAAAHAGCFSMALSGVLERAGFTAKRIVTTAKVSFDKLEAGFRITRIVLETEAVVPGIDAATFAEKAEAAKTGCPVSNALNPSIEIVVNPKLVG